MLETEELFDEIVTDLVLRGLRFAEAMNRAEPAPSVSPT